MERNKRTSNKLRPDAIAPRFYLKEKHLSNDQKVAYDAIVSNENNYLFLTGPAGCGKSFIIDYLRSTIARTVVVATTGAAAQLIQGRTLHSFAGIHPRWGVIDSHKADERMRACQLLIIDEISMAAPSLMLNVFRRFSKAGHAPKLLVVGDFMQLPPVEGGYLFEAPFWGMFKTVTLTQQHRQKDGEFVSILNDIRMGQLTARALSMLAERRVDVLPDDCTQLVALREMAEETNVARLSRLPGSLYKSAWEVDAIKDIPDLSKARFVETLQLKKNARVVLLTNDDQGLWVNGSTGAVVDVSRGAVTVALDSGKTVTVGKAEEEIYDADGDVICTLTQYPIRLAWALTTHRAQGASIDRVGVDLSNHFAPGQTYVALSRCRSKEGLFVKGKLDRLLVDERVVKYYEKCA